METKLNIVDVNRFNPSVDWEKVKTQTDGIIIRVGYRGVDGGVAVDPIFTKYVKEAIAVGVERIGAYWWSSYSNESDADVDASYLMTILQQYKEKINFGIWLQSKPFPNDCEFNNMSAEERTECALTFMTNLERQGLRSGILASDSWLEEELVLSKLSKHPLWVAKSGDTPPEISCEYAGWQYTSSGTVDGIKRGAGMSWFYTDLAAK